jgi:tetratricopeptide (TPR) repeat protein
VGGFSWIVCRSYDRRRHILLPQDHTFNTGSFSPLVAQGVELDVAPAFIVPLPAEETPVPASTALPETPTVATIESTTAQVAEPVQPEVAVAEAEDMKPPVTEATATPAQGMAEENNVLPEKIQVDEQAIAISRTKSVDKKDQQINAAYAQYNSGNYIQAEAAYQEVLKTMPENRDALLGMAAIAWRKGNVRGAYEYYLKVLKLYPRDAVAITGMISLQDNTDPLRNESTIKLMLREQPETAFLHFALGNNYAIQSRWPEAQQAFFEAYRLQSDNPDYAYNLAVSLDHIGQSRAAMDYYNKALEQADSTQVSFNTTNVLARVNDLTQVSNQ